MRLRYTSLQLAVSADVHCEASYYNEHLSVWEPLLEPLEGPKTGKLETWCLKAEVRISDRSCADHNAELEIRDM